ncbi:hypothetical protein F5878DRAFT_622873 [Lentinula raphanica]|uniref:Uncharacterized protein n=1 Tax=Lentinula raphanica TaxID=153919 RepID=A0AA38UDH3_9AGAR|nr:hypothetical protein F5878DRAFT_622873 [Lentinula raphanica]
MHFRIIFFIVWLVAAACAAPIPQRSPVDTSGFRSTAENTSLPVMVEIKYDRKGFPDTWGGLTTDQVKQKMKDAILAAVKAEKHPLFSEGREVKWDIREGQMNPETKAQLAFILEYYPCNSHGCPGSLGGSLDLHTLKVTLPPERRS